MLDYTINSIPERINYLRSIDLSKENLELCANYILYLDKKTPSEPSKYSNNKLIPLDQAELQPEKTSKYTNPKQTINWAHPILQQYRQDIDILKLLENKTTNSKTKYQLRQWKLQHAVDAGIVNKIIANPINTHPTWTQQLDLDILDFVDFTNSFHVKQVILHYSALRQSPQSKHAIEWFDEIVEKTQLTPWQKHLLVRRIDGTHHITIGRELATQFGKIVSPSYMSQVMRVVYKQIAQQAEQEELKWYYRNAADKWKICKKCGEKKLDNSFHWHKSATVCKQCSKTKSANKEETHASRTFYK